MGLLWVLFLLSSGGIVFIAWMLLRSGREKPREPLIAVILSISTGNPRHKCTRGQALRSAARIDHCSAVAPVLERIYNNSRIDTRYFCVPGLGAEDGEGGVAWGEEEFYPPDYSYTMSSDKRFQRFRECALPLATAVAGRALSQAGVAPSQIGRLVLVTSTGEFGMRLDRDLAKAIGLRDGVDRELVTFQGCGASINGLRLASQYATCGYERYALLVSVELPSLHARGGGDTTVNDAILHAIFGDGCAAVVVGGFTANTVPSGSLSVLTSRSWLVDGTDDGIKMTLGGNGVLCRLSKHLPDYVSATVADFVGEVLEDHSLQQREVDFWAVHSGGHRIVEETRKSLGLYHKDTEASWGVLRDYGNMVSATVLFVLERAMAKHQELRMQGRPGLRHVVALSFSPGVTVEGLLLRPKP